MKTLNVQFVGDLKSHDSWEAQFQDLPLQSIQEVSWPSYPYRPQVDFKIGYGNKHIYLQFHVKEKHLKAVYREINEPVYKDSCVEFFLSFDGKAYYNMEFNSLGTALVGYGESRESREYLPADLIQKIQTHSVINPVKPGEEEVSWKLQIQIPFELFFAESPLRLQGRTCYANFYKCGDDLPKPHYVSWNKIEAPEPDFHRPEYFGEIKFV